MIHNFKNSVVSIKTWRENRLVRIIVYIYCVINKMENPPLFNKNLKESSDFSFPFRPYNIQLQFMQNLYAALENKQLGIFESPTGTVCI